FMSFLFISIGLMTMLAFGFVPVLNLLVKTSIGEMYLTLFWLPFGISCLFFGYFVDIIKKRKYLCLCFLAWGLLVFSLNLSKQNNALTILLIIFIAIATSMNMIIGTSYINSNNPINKRGLKAGIYLGLGWIVLALISLFANIDLYLTISCLGILNLITGIIMFILLQVNKTDLKWRQLVSIPKDFSTKKNLIIYYISSIVFGMFLGLVIFLMGTLVRFEQLMSSIYLHNVKFLLEMATSFNLYIVNFEFLAIGALCAIFSPIIGKFMDKYGRKPIFFLANVLLPSIFLLFPFMGNFIVSLIVLIFYGLVCTIYVALISTVWADLAPEKHMSLYCGIGWSAHGIGGSIGFIIGIFMTSPLIVGSIDLVVIMILVFLLVTSFIPLHFMKDSLPPSEEMEWYKYIQHLHVISKGGVIMSDYSFLKDDMVDPNLFSGGISGIGTMLHEMVRSAQKLQIIDHEDKKILFEYGKRFIITLITEKDLRILRTKLKSLAREIHNVFWETIGSWDGDLTVFKPIKTMIRYHFVEE
ncbi:MAG: MFS transporter, partial [Candidatus Hodarchaeota archaeon]